MVILILDSFNTLQIKNYPLAWDIHKWISFLRLLKPVIPSTIEKVILPEKEVHRTFTSYEATLCSWGVSEKHFKLEAFLRTYNTKLLSF